MKRTQIQFTEEQMATIRERAAQLGVSVSDVVRQAVDRCLPGAARNSAAELRRRAEEAAGKYASGSTDVAARHDDYLADAFGR